MKRVALLVLILLGIGVLVYAQQLSAPTNLRIPGGESDSTAPSIPTNLSAIAISSSQIDISWAAASDAESGISSYKLYWCSGSTICTPSTITSLGNQTSYSDTGLTAGTPYRYQVSAVNGAGLEGGKSSVVGATTLVGGGNYPNQPAGFVGIAEYNAAALPADGPVSDPNDPAACSSTGVLDGCWWKFGSSNLSVVSESTAPQSATGVFQFRYPTGQNPGNGVGILQGWDTAAETTNTEYREVYESGWVRTKGSDFENQAVGTKMLGYWGAGESDSGSLPRSIYQVSIGTGTTEVMSSWNIRFAQQNVQTRNLPQTAGGAVWQAGQWHHYEVYMELNDIGVANGVLKVWWDGQLILDYTDIVHRTSSNPSGFYGRRLDPVWGGTGGTNKTREDYLQYDHIYISGILK